jgi:hypothetical protein
LDDIKIAHGALERRRETGRNFELARMRPRGKIANAKSIGARRLVERNIHASGAVGVGGVHGDVVAALGQGAAERGAGNRRAAVARCEAANDLQDAHGFYRLVGPLDLVISLRFAISFRFIPLRFIECAQFPGLAGFAD